jgi:hypothetical protein
MSVRLIRRSCHDAAALGILCQAGNTRVPVARAADLPEDKGTTFLPIVVMGLTAIPAGPMSPKRRNRHTDAVELPDLNGLSFPHTLEGVSGVFERGRRNRPEIDEEQVKELHAKTEQLAVANYFLEICSSS